MPAAAAQGYDALPVKRARGARRGVSFSECPQPYAGGNVAKATFNPLHREEHTDA